MKEIGMKAVVVYESHWGNTEAVARAVADGIGPQAQALATDEASAAALEGVSLIVAGAPVMAFGLPNDRALAGLEESGRTAPRPPDLSHPSLRRWLSELPAGYGLGAAFETRIWWSPRGATGTIERELAKAGYRRLLKSERFIVTGGYGPLRDGELERARAWGAEVGAATRAAVAASAA
jgi:hypothetical protein